MTCLLEGNNDTDTTLPQIEEMEEVGFMRPPARRKQAGRPAEKRIRSAGHQHQPGSGGVAPRKCSRCKLPGHNAASCQQPPPSTFSSAFGPVSDPYM